MRIKNNLSLALIVLLTIIVSCSKDTAYTPKAADVIISNTNTSGIPEGDTNNTSADEDDIVENATFENTVKIVFSGTSAIITNPVTDNVIITQNDGDVTVESTISKVAYEVSGTISDGSLKIYSDKKFKLSLIDVNITNSNGPAINVQSKKTVFVVLEGTNRLTDAITYSNIPTTEDAKAAFFSEGQLVFSGTGTLNVAGKYKHSIASDDYIRVREGNIIVSQSAKDALHTNDYIVIDGGTLNLTASSDGLDCSEGYIVINDGTFKLDVADDGIVASYDISEETEPNESITPNVTINGGIFDINTSEGEGIEAKNMITINGGTFNINTKDDGINAIESLYINGGEIFVYSSSNDAIDSNGIITVTGGTTIAIGSRAPEGGVDADDNTFKITGGTLLGLGGTTTSPTASASTQNAVIFDGLGVNTILHIQSTTGNEALTYKIPSTVSTILYSSAKLETGKTYNLYTGGSVSNDTDFNGLYTSGDFSGGSALNLSFTINSTVTQIGGKIGPGGR